MYILLAQTSQSPGPCIVYQSRILSLNTLHVSTRGRVPTGLSLQDSWTPTLFSVKLLYSLATLLGVGPMCRFHAFYHFFHLTRMYPLLSLWIHVTSVGQHETDTNSNHDLIYPIFLHDHFVSEHWKACRYGKAYRYSVLIKPHANRTMPADFLVEVGSYSHLQTSKPWGPFHACRLPCGGWLLQSPADK